MKKIILMTETGSDITPELAAKYGIHIVPMHVTFGDKTVDDMTFDPEKIREVFGLSKAAFKRAVGKLYKERKIALENGEIREV